MISYKKKSTEVIHDLKVHSGFMGQAPLSSLIHTARPSIDHIEADGAGRVVGHHTVAE